MVRAAAGRRSGRRGAARAPGGSLPRVRGRRRTSPSASRQASRDTVLQRHDGRVVRALPDERRYSTRSLLRAEERLVRRALQGPRRRSRARGSAGDRACHRRSTDALRRAGGDGPPARRRRRRAWRSWSVSPVPARRTRSLPRERRGKQSGTPVIGAAIAWRAARGLEDEAGIPVDEHRGAAGSARDAIGCRGGACSSSMRRPWSAPGQLVELSEAVRSVRGKLVLVGDDRQVPEIEAGGAFRGLRTIGFRSIELRENRRQVEPWEQRRARAAARWPRPGGARARTRRTAGFEQATARRDRAARRGLVDRAARPSGA